LKERNGTISRAACNHSYRRDGESQLNIAFPASLGR
jgi:hypothetical protein